MTVPPTPPPTPPNGRGQGQQPGPGQQNDHGSPTRLGQTRYFHFNSTHLRPIVLQDGSTGTGINFRAVYSSSANDAPNSGTAPRQAGAGRGNTSASGSGSGGTGSASGTGSGTGGTGSGSGR